MSLCWLWVGAQPHLVFSKVIWNFYTSARDSVVFLSLKARTKTYKDDLQQSIRKRCMLVELEGIPVSWLSKNGCSRGWSISSTTRSWLALCFRHPWASRRRKRFEGSRKSRLNDGSCSSSVDFTPKHRFTCRSMWSLWIYYMILLAFLFLLCTSQLLDFISTLHASLGVSFVDCTQGIIPVFAST